MDIKQLKWVVPAICGLFLLSGCALWDSMFGPEDEPTPAEIMAEGMNDYNDGRFKESIEIFQKIKDRYPYSTFAITAELKMADALYERGGVR